MEKTLSSAEWAFLTQNGYVRLKGAFEKLLPTLKAATDGLAQQFPYGFSDPHYYTGKIPQPLTRDNARPDGRIMIPYAGFKNLDILTPLANPYLHELLERIVGKDFYLSNTWYQEVPRGAGRLGYHKDPRGSISFNILLDEIGHGMGSTCLVPGSHINTPPATFCMSNHHSAHPREVDLTGGPGDLVLFSPETWHARSMHTGSYRTRRLIYNFYSRSSRDTTTWAGVVDPEIVERARVMLPSEYSHMFDINHHRSRELALINGSTLKSWAYRKSSSEDIVRDFFYSAYTYGQSVDNLRQSGMLLPFTTRLSESRPFSAIEYFSNLKLIPTLKNIYTFCRKLLQQRLQKILPAMAAKLVTQAAKALLIMAQNLSSCSRRRILSWGAAGGVLGVTGLSAQTGNAPGSVAGKFKVIITLNGAEYTYPGGPKIPSYDVGFRGDGRIVFHLGALGNLSGPSATANAYHLPSHHARIERDGEEMLDATIPGHWWNAEWTYRPKPLVATRTPAQLVAANRMFLFGDTGYKVGVVRNYKFAGPMDSAGVTTYMPTTGERPDIGCVTDPSGHFMLTKDDGPMLAWAQAAGSCPLHFRDETTGKPIDLVKHPQTNAYDAPGYQGAPWLPKGPKDPDGYTRFGGGWTPQQAHFCEMSYVAHVATGDMGFLEDLQFSANFCVLTDAAKSTPAGAIISGEQRGIAWALRELFMAHIATKDAEAAGTLPASCHPSGYWQSLLDRSRAYYDKYRTDPRNQGFRLFAADYRFGPWQQDYCLTALAFGLLTGHSEWKDIYLFALGNAIDRTSGKSGYPVGWGGAYYLNTHEWAKNADGTYNQGAYDFTKPLDWYGTFLFQQNDPNSLRPTQAQIEDLKADQFHGGVAITGHEYLMTTRAVLVMADYLDKKGLAGVRKTYPDLDICRTNVDRMVRAGGYANARDSVVAA